MRMTAYVHTSQWKRLQNAIVLCSLLLIILKNSHGNTASFSDLPGNCPPKKSTFSKVLFQFSVHTPSHVLTTHAATFAPFAPFESCLVENIRFSRKMKAGGYKQRAKYLDFILYDVIKFRKQVLTLK